MQDRRAIGALAIVARQRRATHLASLRAVAVREGDLKRARVALAEAGKARNRARNAVEQAECALRAARWAAGLGNAA